MQFWSYGPFPADPRNKSLLWDAAREAVEDDGFENNDLRSAIGCYVFVMARGKSIVPWYVGKTNALTGFQGEIFTPHKVGHYTAIMEEKPHWKPQMLLFPVITPTRYFSKAYSTNKALIEWMEKTLIGMALAKNPNLYNKRDTVMLKNCIVDGVFGAFKKNQRYPAALAARNALTHHQDYFEDA